jgi:hypothetical protein
LRYLNSRMFAITIYVFSLFSPSLFEDGDWAEAPLIVNRVLDLSASPN